MALTLSQYRPIRLANKIRCPVLVQACMKDTVVSPEAAVRFATAAPNGTLCRYEEMGHFSIYVGEGFDKAVADQVAFLRRALSSDPSFVQCPASTHGESTKTTVERHPHL